MGRGQEQAAAGKFAVEVTLSFDAAKDDCTGEEPALVVRMAGRDLIRADQPVAAGESLRAEDVSGIAQVAMPFSSAPCPGQIHFQAMRRRG